MHKPVAFLFPAFPVLHQTFVLWEVLALRRLGVEIKLYSIRRRLGADGQKRVAELFDRGRNIVALAQLFQDHRARAAGRDEDASETERARGPEVAAH